MWKYYDFHIFMIHPHVWANYTEDIADEVDYALTEGSTRDFYVYFTSTLSLNNRIMTLTLSYFYEN